MKFIIALRVLLGLGLFKQAETQIVTVTIGESGPDVLIEWTGSLAVLPGMSIDSFPYSSNFFIGPFTTIVSSASDLACKRLTDFMDHDLLCGSHNWY